MVGGGGVSPRKSETFIPTAIDAMDSQAGCYYCGAVLVNIASLSEAKLAAFHKGLFTCGRCSAKGLPSWRHGDLKHNMRRAVLRRELMSGK